jgi:hypothetical protein
MLILRWLFSLWLRLNYLQVLLAVLVCFRCRILRARKYDTAAALKLVAGTAEWRAASGISALSARAPSEVLGCLEGTVHATLLQRPFQTSSLLSLPVNSLAFSTDELFGFYRT